MAERNVIRFLIIAGASMLAITGLATMLPEMLDIPAAYGLTISAAGIALILFAWHIWVQTSPGGIHLEEYVKKAPRDRLIDFLTVVGVSAVVAAIGVIIGIEFDLIVGDEMWAGDTMNWIAETVIVLIGMAVGILVGLRRNSDIRIER